VCWGVASMTSNTWAMKCDVTRAWKRSLMELTKTIRGVRHFNGWSSELGCMVTAKPGPDVRGSPSFWYFSAPIAFRRFDRVRA